MSYELVITKVITKRVHFKGDEEALDEYIEEIESGEVEFDDIHGAIEENYTEVVDSFELEEE